MSSYSSDDETTLTRGKLFDRHRPIHDVLGGGKVADILLWKNRNMSIALTIGITLIWFLFEVVEYNFVTLFCHISITCMLILFIWCSGAEFFNWRVPKIPETIFDKRTFNEVASAFHGRFNKFLSKLLDIACGKHPALFVLTIVGLYILSVIGNYFTFLNFVYFVYISLQTVPFLYDRYEAEVDDCTVSLSRQVRKMYRRFDSKVLNKIPRGPVKEKHR
ncbi:reticulon-like protein B9 [Euphorbia lathyris]|uniref:reticulon-like protein B9 n=1 Tax=Euphorbia lathyris TaxID=212925 RepID=UPI0033144672